MGILNLDLNRVASLIKNEDDFVLELKNKGELSKSNLTRFIYIASYKNIKHEVSVSGLSQEEIFKKYKLIEKDITSGNEGAVINRPLEKLNESKSERMSKKNFIEKYDDELESMKNLNDVLKFIKKYYINSDEFLRLELYLQTV